MTTRLVTSGAAEPALAPVRSLTRKDSVVAEIKRGIVVGAIAPGQRLTELDLAGTLGVSRPTIREAMMQLTREGVLVAEPYKGIHVATATADDIMQLARLREALDLLALDQLYADSTGAALAAVLRAWREFESLESHSDPLVRHQAHIAFHRAVWAAAESPTLLHVAPVVEGLMTVALARDLHARPDPARQHSSHSAYVDALLSRKLTVARRAIHEHTVGNAQTLIALLGS